MPRRFRARAVELYPAWAARPAPDHNLDLSVLGQVSETALTRDAEIALGADGLPDTFVSGRNLLFFTLAAALASRRELRHLVGGMCEADYFGYPNCRDDALKSRQVTINSRIGGHSVVHTRLIWLDKAHAGSLVKIFGGEKLVWFAGQDVRFSWRVICPLRS